MKKAAYTLTAQAFCMSTITASAQSWYVRGGDGYSGQSAKTGFNNTDRNGITGIEPSTSVNVSTDGSNANGEALNGTIMNT